MHLCIVSLADNNTFLAFNRDPVDAKLTYHKQIFHPQVPAFPQLGLEQGLRQLQCLNLTGLAPLLPRGHSGPQGCDCMLQHPTFLAFKRDPVDAMLTYLKQRLHPQVSNSESSADDALGACSRGQSAGCSSRTRSSAGLQYHPQTSCSFISEHSLASSIQKCQDETT